MSRQLEKQRANRAAGLCTLCSQQATHGQHCEKHWESAKVARAAYEARMRRAEISGQRTLFEATGETWQSSPKPSSSGAVAYARSGSSGKGSASSSQSATRKRNAGELLDVDDDTPLPVQVTAAGRVYLSALASAELPTSDRITKAVDATTRAQRSSMSVDDWVRHFAAADKQARKQTRRRKQIPKAKKRRRGAR